MQPFGIETNVNSVTDNVVEAFEQGSCQIESDRKPWFLHGWDFLAFVENEDGEDLPVRGCADGDGPSISYNSVFISPERLEDGFTAEFWLPQALHHIAWVVLSECSVANDGRGRFVTERWKAFIDAVCHHNAMDWDEILGAVKREGISYIASGVANALFVESGIHELLIGGRAGHLRSV